MSNKREETAHERIASQCPCCANRRLLCSPAILMPFVAHRVYGWKPVQIDASWNLRTIPHGTAYALCNTLCCPRCGMIFLDLRFTPEELRRLYEDYRGRSYTRLRAHYEPDYRQKNPRLNAGHGYTKEIEDFLLPYLKKPIRLLDWGGATGVNTPFRHQARRIDIYDISEKNLLAGMHRVSKREAARRHYNLLVCSNVLEHTPYPAELLAEIKTVLRQDTILYLEVPWEELMRSGARSAYKKKRHWHEHINFFSECSLERLIDAAGMVLLDQRRLKTSVAGSEALLLQMACRRKAS